MRTLKLEGPIIHFILVIAKKGKIFYAKAVMMNKSKVCRYLNLKII